MTRRARSDGTEYKSVCFRISTDTYEKVKDAAERELRSVTAQMEILIKKGLEQSNSSLPVRRY